MASLEASAVTKRGHKLLPIGLGLSMMITLNFSIWRLDVLTIKNIKMIDYI
jgi:hypothetical protein